MKCYDFEYDGLNLSNLGYIVCNFGQDGIQTISNGSQVTFHTVSTGYGSKQELTSVEYQECLETSVQSCKYPCFY